MLDFPFLADLLVAALLGLAVGVEREWSGHASGPDGRFAGARTFTLLGGVGGLAGWFVRLGHGDLAVVAVAAGVLFPIVAWATTVRRPGTTVDGTTETAAILVVLLGVVSGLGHRTAASAATAVAVLLLAEKSSVQRALLKVAPSEMRAALQLAVLALVVLPLLPTGGYGPFGAFRPRALWIVVLLFMGLNFAGHIARRAVGETRGLGVTGLLGGLVSSTAVSLTFSRRSRDEPALSAPLALGVVAACTVLIPRLLVTMSVLHTPLAVAALPVLLPVLLAGAGVVGFALAAEGAEVRNNNRFTAEAAAEERPSAASAERSAPSSASAPSASILSATSAFQMALLFQLVLFGLAWVQEHVGARGVLTSALVLGLTDMDALTVSMTRYAAETTLVRTAAVAVGLGVLANTVLKLSLVVGLGAPRFRLRAGSGLLALAAGSAVGLYFGWP